MSETYIKIYTYPDPDMQEYGEVMTGLNRGYPRECYGSDDIQQPSITYLMTTDRDFAKKLIKKVDIARLLDNGFDHLWKFQLFVAPDYFMTEDAKDLTDKTFYEDELTGGLTTQYFPKKGEGKLNK